MKFFGIKQKFKKTAKGLRLFLIKIPKKVWIISVIAVLMIIYTLFFVVPINVNYSYSEVSSCVNRLTFFPNLYKQSQSDECNISVADGFKMGNFYVFSTKSCIKLVGPSDDEKETITYSPFGSFVFSNKYVIHKSNMPIVQNSDNRSTSLLNSLEFDIDSIDGVFDYRLQIGEQSEDCAKSLKKIVCDIKNMNLEQGKEYNYVLLRGLNNENYTEATSGNIFIALPVTIENSSIQDDSIVYSKPKSFVFEFNKEIKSAELKLYKINGDNLEEISSNYIIDKKIATLNIPEDLSRKNNYKIIISNVEGSDGSILESDKKEYDFYTSDGPTVTGINIGTGGINLNARIVITFDQSLSSNQNINDYVSISNGKAVISASANQIVLQLNNMSVCEAFSINIKQGLRSSNDVTATSSWSYSSRTSCRTTDVIGYSVQGRPIYVYYYGGGSTTILFTGGIHGTEHSGQYIMEDWADYLDLYAYDIPSDRRVVIIPNINPDGLAGSYRYNANNVNLDRNFPTANWISDIDTYDGIIIGGGGSEPLSEPEASALASLTASLQPKLEVSFHAQGSLVGANQYGDSVPIGNLYASSVGYSSMIGIAEEVMGYHLTGEYEDWMGEQYGISAILIELPTTYGNYFNYHLSTLWKMVRI